MDDAQLMSAARDHGAPFDLVREVASSGKLPVVNFAAGGIATPADAALMMSLGVDGVFVGSGIFKSSGLKPTPGRSSRRPRSGTSPKWWQGLRGLGEAMPGIEIGTLRDTERLAERGW